MVVIVVAVAAVAGAVAVAEEEAEEVAAATATREVASWVLATAMGAKALVMAAASTAVGP